MPVRKFRSVSEMDDARWFLPNDPALFRAIAQCWDLARRCCPQRLPPGVYRYRTIEEAQAARNARQQCGAFGRSDDRAGHDGGAHEDPRE